MAVHYPFKSETKKRLGKLREGQDYYIWQAKNFDLQRIVKQLSKPVIEIGGPTDLGFYFVEGIAFNSKPIITNSSANPLPYAINAKKLAKMVDDIVDGRDMPYGDGDVGVFLVSAMSSSDDWWVELKDDEKDKQRNVFNRETDVAMLEEGQFALGTLPLRQVKFAQRLQIYAEAYRALQDKGLLIADGNVEDLVSLQRIGFKLISYLQEHTVLENWSGMSYEFVMQK